jgi:hypothetical protein
MPINRADDEKEWLTKLEKLKRSYSEGRDVKIECSSHSINCLLSRQRKLNRLDLLKRWRKEANKLWSFPRVRRKAWKGEEH